MKNQGKTKPVKRVVKKSTKSKASNYAKKKPKVRRGIKRKVKHPQKVNISNLAILRTRKLTKDRIIIIIARIKYLLTKNKVYRDNDILLCNRFQSDELKKLKLHPKNLSAKEYMKIRQGHLITTEETICRLRRMVQQLYVRTRGKKYLKRQNKALEVMQDMKGAKNGMRRIETVQKKQRINSLTFSKFQHEKYIGN